MAAPAADPILDLLRRELYWARGGEQVVRADGVSGRDRLYAYALHRRTDETMRFPLDEPALEASPLRRLVKVVVWRLTRFATRRYDRLLAELAELDVGLAERLIATEDEIARLRAEVDELRRDRA
jgi:hypothetical protein